MCAIVRQPGYRVFRQLRPADADSKSGGQGGVLPTMALQRFAACESLDLEDVCCTATHLAQFLSHARALRKVNMFNAQIDFDSIDVDQCPTQCASADRLYTYLSCLPLHTLNLTDTEVDYRLTSALFGGAAARASQCLRFLSFSHCAFVDDACVDVVLRHASSLEAVDVTRCERLTRECSDLFARCASPYLRCVVLTGLDCVDSEFLRRMFGEPASSLLRSDRIELSFEACRQLVNADLGFLARVCGAHLHELGALRFLDAFLESQLARLCLRRATDVCGNAQISDAGIEELVSSGGVPKLHFLDVSGCDLTDDSLRHLLSSAPRLCELHIEHCARMAFEAIVDDVALHELVSIPTALSTPCCDVTPFCFDTLDHRAQCAHRQSSNIPDLHAAASKPKFHHPSLTTLHCKQSGISSAALLHLAVLCPSLTRIDMRECRQASMSSRSTLPRIAFFKFLMHPSLALGSVRELHLSHAAALDSEFLCSLVRHRAHQLTALSLTYFPSSSVDELVVEAIAASCRQLRDLNLAHCSGVTDAALAQFCRDDGGDTRQLARLNVGGCPCVTLRSALDFVLASGRAGAVVSSLSRSAFVLSDDHHDFECAAHDDDLGHAMRRLEYASNMSLPAQLPYLISIYSARSGIGCFGRHVLRHASLLEAFVTMPHHWAQKFM